MSVKAKLSAGFAILLLLILFIAFFATSSLNGLMESNDKVKQLSSINYLVQEARLEEKNYLLRGEQQYVESAQKLIESATATLESAQEFLESPEQKAAIAKILADLESYKARLLGAVDQLDESEAAQVAMEEAAREAVALFVELEQVLQERAMEQLRSGQEIAARDSFRLVDKAGEMARQMLGARIIEKNYVRMERPADAVSLGEQVDSLKEGVAEIGLALSGAGQAARINQLGGALQTYEVQFQSLTRNLAQLGTEVESMTTAARSAISQSDAALSAQVSAMTALKDQASRLMLIVTVAALVLGVGAALLITRMIVGPLDQLVGHAGRVADGDLTHNINTDRKDELGRLMMAMQVMTENLRHMVKEVADGVAQIASASEELSAVTEQTSAGAGQQRSETDQVATAMNQMTATVQEVARNAESAARSAAESDAQAKEGQEVVSSAVIQIEKLADEVGDSAELITKLRDDSANIGTVLDVIRGIAEQTNLLALNAAIEAARAGETGRGFAVVADEVRALARRTHESTGEIETLVKTLQQGANDAVESMNRNSAGAASSVEVARQAGEALANITQAVSNIQSLNQQIATAVEEQTSVAENISESVVSIREVTDQTATANSQIAVSSNDLARLGGDLQRIVQRFKHT